MTTMDFTQVQNLAFASQVEMARAEGDAWNNA